MAAGNIYNRICDFFDRWLKPRRDRREISALESREFSDLGISRSEAVALVSGPTDVRERIAGMAERVGVDFGEMMETRWRALDLVRVCGSCTQRRTCAKYLRGHGPRDDYKDFCPNAKIFESLSETSRAVH